jgi:hypothetical protein
MARAFTSGPRDLPAVALRFNGLASNLYQWMLKPRAPIPHEIV